MAGNASRANGQKGGRPKGSLSATTLKRNATKQEIRDYIQARVAMELGPIVDAQIANAQGIRHFVLRDKGGKFEKVTSEAAALAAMNDPESVYEFWTKDPSVQAFQSLIDRAADKPKEQPQEIALNGKVTLERLVVESSRRPDGA